MRTNGKELKKVETESSDEVVESLETFVKASDEEWKSAVSHLKKAWRALPWNIRDKDAVSDNEKKTTSISTELENVFCRLTEIREALRCRLPQPKGRLIETGRNLFREQRYEEALACFEGALLDPELHRGEQEHRELLICSATSAFFCKRLDRAEELCDLLLKLDSEQSQAYVIKALVMRESENWQVALSLIDKARELKPHSDVIEKYRADILKQMSQVNRKTGIFKRRWARAAVEGKFLVHDHINAKFKTLNVEMLSAGGCLLDGADLPDEFHFSMSIGSDSERIWGRGRKLYTTAEKKVGVAFQDVSKRNELRLDRHVQIALRSKPQLS